MNRFRRLLLLVWIAVPVGVFLLFAYGPSHPLTLVIFAAGILVERKVTDRVRHRIPTFSEFCQDDVVARRLMLAYGFTLSILAIWLLTAGQKYGYGLWRYMPLIGAVIVSPIVLALAAYQLLIFRVLGKDDV